MDEQAPRAVAVGAATAVDLRARAETIALREVAPDGPEAVAAMGHYFAELAARFPDGFDPGAPPPPDSFTVATSDDNPYAELFFEKRLDQPLG